MKINITGGIGEGKTTLSAFDNALLQAGVHNYNLITLSSIIPTGATIVVRKPTVLPEEYGYRLYVVRADQRSRESGKWIGAALGWYQLSNGAGMFVEHETIEDTESAVIDGLNLKVKQSLSDLCQNRKIAFSSKNMRIKISHTQVKQLAACVLVLAVFQSEPWQE